MTLKLDTVKAWGIVIAGSIAAYAVYRAYKTGVSIKDGVVETASKIGDAAKGFVTETVNPASDKNIVYKTISDATVGEDNTLGGAIYDWLHPSSYSETSHNAGRIENSSPFQSPDALSIETYEQPLGNAP